MALPANSIDATALFSRTFLDDKCYYDRTCNFSCENCVRDRNIVVINERGDGRMYENDAGIQ